MANVFNKFDIIGFAKKIINEIDAVRSYSSDADTETSLAFNRPEESRINAFMRLIGLPMFVSIEKDGDKSSGELAGNRILNSGWCGGKFSGYKIKNMDDKISSSGLSLSSELEGRESALLEIENKIGSEEMNKNMSDAITTPIPLIASSEKPIVVNGKINRVVNKKLFPLITSYRIVMPRQNEMAKPFSSAQDRKIDFNTELKQPFLETVIRIRTISMENAGNANENVKKDDFLNSVKSNVNDEEFKEIKKIYFQTLTEVDVISSFILDKLLTALPQLANSWVQLKRSQEYLKKEASYKVSIKTTSSKVSLFGKRMDVAADPESMDKSEIGIKLKELKTKLSKEEAFLSLLPSLDVSDVGNSKVASTKNTSPGALVGPFADLLNTDAAQLREEIETYNERIKQNIVKLEGFRLQLDVMTGEFSGISIPDVVSIIIALFMIDRKYLIALLDDDVKDNMRKDATLTNVIKKYENAVPGSSIEKAAAAIQELQKAVEFIFDILNKIINSKHDRTNRNKEITKEPEDKIEGDISFDSGTASG